MPLLQKEEKPKCLTSQLRIERLQLGYQGIGRYLEFCNLLWRA